MVDLLGLMDRRPLRFLPPPDMVPIRRTLGVLFQMKLAQRFILGLKTSLTACIEQEYHENGYVCLEKQDEADLCANTR